MKLKYIPEGSGTNRSSTQSNASDLIVGARPNPTSGELFFDITTAEATEYTIQVFSAAGQKLTQRRVQLQEGPNRVEMEAIANWPERLYYFRVTSSSGDYSTGQFVKN